HAKKELEFFNTDIKKLSEKLSFSSQSHFTRVFKKYTGITPSEYREQVFLNKVKKSLSI
ncbi:MAG: helix-turn-helix transcriptional regulator, partial [Bacilli bacterium]|nr:helix-turn-helix transcriptional regulator [Bacilli bacterium]